MKRFVFPFNSPIQTSPNCPAPSFFTILMESLEISQASLSHGFWTLGLKHGRSSLRHRPSGLSARGRCIHLVCTIKGDLILTGQVAGPTTTTSLLTGASYSMASLLHVTTAILTVVVLDQAADVGERDFRRDVTAAVVQHPDLIMFDWFYPLVVDVSDGQWITPCAKVK